MPQAQPANNPSQGGRPRKQYRIRIRDERPKQPNTDLLLHALVIMAEDEARKKLGLPPIDDGSVADELSSQ